MATNIKVVIVGDPAVGKSVFFLTWKNNELPRAYMYGSIPTVLDEYSAEMMVDGKPVSLSLFDTAGTEDYDRLRPLSYPQTDVVLIAFSVDLSASFENVRAKWVPEIKQHCPNTPWLLLGLKADLRYSSAAAKALRPGRGPLVTHEVAKDRARKLGAVGYYECSALTRRGLNEAMCSAVMAVLCPSEHSLKRFTRFTRIRTTKANTCMNISTSTFAGDWKRMVNCEDLADVAFLLGPKTYHAHKYVLCCASDVFRRMFGVEDTVGAASLIKVTPKDFRGGKVAGLKDIKYSGESGKRVTTITLDETLISEVPFIRCLEFLYTGNVDLEAKSTLIDETIKVAELFNLPELQTIRENAHKGEDCSILCIQNMMPHMNSMFLNQPQLSDVRLMVEGKVIHAHKIVFMARCDVRSDFTESQVAEVELHDSTYENVLAFLEYLYTDRGPFQDGDPAGFLILSYQYLKPRIKSVCEHYLAEAVEKAQVTNVIALLLTKGHLDLVKTLIIAGADINQTNKDGKSLLMVTLDNGHIVKTLIEAGANVNQSDNDGWSPLMIAISKGHLEVVKILIEAGANVNQTDKDDITPLYVASKKGHHEVVQTLLGAGADVNIPSSYVGKSLLMIALTNGHLDIVKTLIEAGANVNQSNKEGNTPLHHVARAGHTAWVKYLLSTPGIAVTAKNKRQQTPLMVATKYDVITSLQKYSTCKEDYPVHTFNKVILCGDTGAGKSSLAKAIIKSSKSAGRIGYVKTKLNLDEVAKPLTAGIVAYQVQNSKSNMMLYDFAGHHTYYSSHSSLLEAISLTSPSTFLMLVDVTVGFEGITAQMYYWSAMICNVCHECTQPSSVIVVGTHADKVKKGYLTDLGAQIEKLAKDMFEKHNFVQFTALNLKKYGNDLKIFLDLLDGVNENVLKMSPAISLSSHLMYAFLNDKIPSDKEAISLSGLLSLIENDKPRVLPTETSEIITLLKTLAHKGFIIFFHTDGEDSWIVRDQGALLEKVNGALFAPSSFKEHLPIASNTGIIPLNVLKSHFPNHNTAMVVQFLIQLQLCQRINLIDVNTNMAPTIPSPSDVLFFPSLIREDRPHFNCSDITTPPFNNSEGAIAPTAPVLQGCFGWLLYADNISQFFPNRFLHTLLLKLAYNICRPDKNHQIINADIQSNNRQCKVWSTGISWRSVKGVSTTIELMEHSRCLFLLMAFPDQTFCNQLAPVLQTIKAALSQFCPSVAATEYIVDPSTASSVFLQGCSPLSLTRVQLSHLRDALKDDDPVVLDTNGEVVVLKNWTSVGLDLPRLLSIAVNGDDIIQEKQAATINPPNGCTPVVPFSPSQPLSQLVAQGIPQLEETPTMQELLCFSDQKVNIAVQIGAKYCNFGIFLLNDTTGVIVEALELEYRGNAERINMAILQQWLQGKGVKPVSWSTLVTALQKINL